MKFKKFHFTEVLGEQVSRVVIAIYKIDVDNTLLTYFSDIVISDVDVLRLRLHYRIGCDKDRPLIISRDRYAVDVVSKFSK